MFNHPLALELAYTAVEEALRLGASYADARYELRQHEDVTTANGALLQAAQHTERGFGLRVLLRGAWGYAAISEPNRHDVGVVVRRAVELARAASVLQDRPVELAEAGPHRVLYRTPIKRDPLAVPLEDKVQLLLGIDERLRAKKEIVLAEGSFAAHRQRKIFVNSEGSEIDQELVYTGIGYRAGASDGERLCMRSFPGGPRGTFQGRGWEMVGELPLLEQAERVADEAIQLLGADPCPAGAQAVIFDAGLTAELARATGELLELDRALGAAGEGAFFSASELGRFELGSPAVSLYADAREPGGAGTFAFDDEGVEGQRVELVHEGRLEGFLSGRESAKRVGLERSTGAMRAAGWASSPSVRGTNLCLEPGSGGDLEALIADTRSGLLLETPLGVTLGASGRDAHVRAEVAWEIRDGKKARLLQGPAFVVRTADLWKRCDAVADRSAWALFGAGRGRPARRGPVAAVGRGAAPARFGGLAVTLEAAPLGPASLERPLASAEQAGLSAPVAPREVPRGSQAPARSGAAKKAPKKQKGKKRGR